MAHDFRIQVTYPTSYGWGVNRWVVTEDGERFLLNLSIKNPNPGFTVTKNWVAAVGSR